MAANAPRTYGIYVHYPYCVSKCHYCDFNSYAVSPDPNWTEGIEKQFARDDPRRTSETLASIYFGGGTPSLLPPGEVASLLELLSGSHAAETLEITLETNPGTVTQEKLKAFRRAGVNRLSVGVQSFDNAVLRFLGRAHDSRDARKCLDAAREAGFENIGLDLILGSRASNFRSLTKDLRAVEDIAPEHVSVYFLTLEGNTPFVRRKKKGECLTLSEEDQRRQYRDAVQALGDMGLDRYEISNFARKGRESVHNRLYWRGDEYLGLGPGASGFVYREFPLSGRRTRTHTDPKKWLDELRCDGEFASEIDKLGTDELGLERIMLELRQVDGLDLRALLEIYGIDLLSRKKDALRRMTEAGWLCLDEENRRLKLTDEGVFIADSVILSLV